MTKIGFYAADTKKAQEALKILETQYNSVPMEDADVIIALGGDGTLLECLRDIGERNIPVYGMNLGSVGFLLNTYTCLLYTSPSPRDRG